MFKSDPNFLKWLVDIRRDFHSHPEISHQERRTTQKIVEILNIWTGAPSLSKWEEIVHMITSPKFTTNIAVVGKYVDLIDSYKSLNEALLHGGIANNCRVNLLFVDS